MCSFLVFSEPTQRKTSTLQKGTPAPTGGDVRKVASNVDLPSRTRRPEEAVVGTPDPSSNGPGGITPVFWEVEVGGKPALKENMGTLYPTKQNSMYGSIPLCG